MWPDSAGLERAAPPLDGTLAALRSALQSTPLTGPCTHDQSQDSEQSAHAVGSKSLRMLNYFYLDINRNATNTFLYIIFMNLQYFQVTNQTS